MLQQTQVTTMLPYYQRFLRRFPDVHRLARAHTESVMAVWSGLGYYARARHLHATAKIIACKGFPQNAASWQTLPGVGKSTAAAITIFAGGGHHAILDGNVKRVLTRVFAIEQPTNKAATIHTLWKLADSLLPTHNIKPYTQGLMDLGATVCVRVSPRCEACPLSKQCLARQRGIERRLPHRSPRPIKSVRHIAMALIYHHNKVWLQKRPHAGIWGGLWSLPEKEATADLRDYCCKKFGDTLTPREEMAFTHTFTHYHLHAKVLCYACYKPPTSSPTAKWMQKGALADAALPAPIKKLLLAFFAP